MDDLLREFLTESAESIEVVDSEVVRLEQNPNDPELLGNIFRLMHTIKGTCGFLGLPRLEKVAHASENVLGKFRDGDLQVTPQAVTVILDSLDRIKNLLAELEATEQETEGDDSELIDRLNAFASGKAEASAAPAAGAAEDDGAAEAAAETSDETPATDLSVVVSTPADGPLFDRLGGFSVLDAVVEVYFREFRGDEKLKGFIEGANVDVLQGSQLANLTQLFGGNAGDTGSDPHLVIQHLAALGIDDNHFDLMLGHWSTAFGELEIPAAAVTEAMALIEGMRDEVAQRPAEQPEVKSEKPEAKVDDDGKTTARAAESSVAAQNIRVNVQLLENLMTMVSELVLTRNQLLQILRKTEGSEFGTPLQRLSQVTSELQEGVMQTRMQPIGNAWAKLPRLIRDLSLELKKKIDLRMNGAETELDRQVLELIKDPLTHMIRNSADHGVEIPAKRIAAGKSETGSVSLDAYHEGGHIVITIADDGAGLPLEKIKAKALVGGLITEAELETMSDQQAQQLIFKAGLSTAEKVTNVSGRGVGMDVVKTNIEKIGGTVELRSIEGKGSSFIIKIPLTLAIVSALIVESGGERFAIPQISVVELVRASSTSEHNIEMLNDTPVLRLRDRLLPLVTLASLLRLSKSAPEDAAAQTEDMDDEKFIVVSQIGTYSFGIIVDRVFDTEEIVVKPVAPILRDIAIFSGNTILGDGSVIMILDPNGIAAQIGDISVGDRRTEVDSVGRDSTGTARVALLVFRAGEKTPKAVPLSLIARLEEIDVAAIETANGRPVTQYRGALMPLIPVSASQSMRQEGRQPIIVLSDNTRSMGLMVDEITDIVDEDLDVELKSEVPGLLGTAAVGGKATEVIDIGHYLNLGFADWFKSFGDLGSASAPARRILLVDDSPFFRNLLTPLLSVAGYDVTTVESASNALELCESGSEFDVIISDIEMPGMNGFEFAEAVRSNSRWRHTRLVALSAHTNPKEIGRGREAGFDDYVAKSDRDALLRSLNETLSSVGGAA